MLYLEQSKIYGKLISHKQFFVKQYNINFLILFKMALAIFNQSIIKYVFTQRNI